MIAGIGVDLATISRVAAVHERHGRRFARRFLHESELSAYDDHPDPCRFLAKRFAVKEAAVKAIGTGERAGILLKDFYLEHDDLGKPLLRVCGAAQVRCESLGIRHFWVSLSDEGDTVAAFVILECD